MFRVPRQNLRFDLFYAFLVGMLLLRGLTPAGYMPGDGPAGLKLCTSVGLVDATSPLKDGEAPAPDTASHVDAVCSFAAAAGGAPTSAVVLQFTAPILVSLATPSSPDIVVRRLLDRAHSPRGPPLPSA